MSQSENGSNNKLAALDGAAPSDSPSIERAPTQAETANAIDWPASSQLMERNVGQRLAIKTGGRLVFLDTSEIDWVEACGNYVRFHARGESYLTRAGIGEVARKLNGAEFLRIHRSTIVHLGKIRELEPCDNGEYILTLKDGKKLSCSRTYSAQLQQLVKQRYSI